MEIIESSAQRLVIVERPWIAAAMLMVFAGVFAFAAVVKWHQMPPLARFMFASLPVVALAMIAGMVRSVRVTFDRVTGRVDITSRGLLGRRSQRLSLRHLKGVRSDEGSEGGSYRVVLSFSEDMLKHMPRQEHARLENNWQRGLRTLPPWDVPLTIYHASSIDGPGLARVICAWAGLEAQGGQRDMPLDCDSDLGLADQPIASAKPTTALSNTRRPSVPPSAAS